MRYLIGSIELTCSRILINGVRSLVKRRPILVVRTKSEPPLQALTHALQIDSISSVTAILSFNETTVLFGTRAGVPVVVRVVPRDSGALSKLVAGLCIAHDSIRMPSLQELLARPIAHFYSNGREVAIHSRLRGHPFAEVRSESEIEERVRMAMQPLLAIHSERGRKHAVPDDRHITECLPSLIDRFPAQAPELRTALRYLREWPREHMSPVVVHGDYWLGNILCDPSGEQVTGIVDWDCARKDGCPGYDALHLVLLTVSMHCQRPLSRCYEEVWTKRWSDNLLSRMIDEVKEKFDLRDGDVEYMTGLLWLTRIYERAGHRSAEWVREQLEEPAQVFNRAAGYSYGSYSRSVKQSVGARDAASTSYLLPTSNE